LLADPEIGLSGLPLYDGAGTSFEERVVSAIHGALDGIPKPRRRDPEVLREAVRRAVRADIRDSWGKKPVCTVLVTVL